MKGLAVYVGLVHRAEQTLADALREVARGHVDEGDVPHTCLDLARLSDAHVRAVAPVAERYGEERDAEPERLHGEGLEQARTGPLGLVRDLQDLYVLAAFVQTGWTVLLQAGRGAHDRELVEVATTASGGTARQLAWLTTRIKEAAPQALLATPS